MNTSRPLLYNSNRKPTRLAGTTMLSNSLSITPCLNGSRMSFALHPSKPPMMGTRRSFPRLTNITGKIAAKTWRPGPPEMPPVTPTGRLEQPMAFDPQSPLTPPTSCPVSPWAEELPAPIDPWDNICQPSSTLLTSMKLWNPWMPTPMTMTTFRTPPTTKKPYAQTGFRIAHGLMCQRKRRRNNGKRACASSVVSRDTLFAVVLNNRKQVSSLGLEDALDCGPDPDVFSTLATLLRAMILTPDSPPVHLPSHLSTNLLLCTTLPFTDNPVPTLVDSSATNNFINESLATLAPHPLQCLPASIPLKLFDGDPTPAGDITHCLEMTLTFANGRQQEL
ncbi:hypothetical protein E4T56_gene10551 [Termitomyces sp. T112]|nr:hypothetical protein E4T56_gene10551 [Termitomyces sp. T112]